MSSYNYKYLTAEPIGIFLPGTNTPGKSFWQSPLWAEILRDTHQADDVILTSDGEAQILIERRSILGKYTGLYILGIRGELVTEALFKHIREDIARRGDLFLQIEPIDFLTGQREHHLGSFRKAPFRRFIEPVTAVLSLQNTTAEALFQTFAEKGRYNIKLATKRGVTTRWVKGYDRDRETGKTYLEVFYDLLEETTKRDKFSKNSLKYYQYFVETLETHNAGGLLIAEKDGVLHAVGIFAYWNENAIYYYGASSSNKDIRRDMATYKLQADAIEEAINRGCKTYDFLGISADGGGKLAGVTEFKLRFNPEKKSLQHERVIVYKPFLLRILQVVSKMKKIFK